MATPSTSTPPKPKNFGIIDRKRPICGTTGERMHRRRLTYIRREFDYEYGVLGRTPNALLFGTTYVKSDAPDDRIVWNPFGTAFLSEARLNLIKGLSKDETDKKEKSDLSPFSVIVSSLPYIVVEGLANVVKTLRPFRQAGTHVFFNVRGELNLIPPYYDVGKVKALDRRYKADYISPVGSVYPVIRYEWDQLEETQDKKVVRSLAFGLFYDTYKHPDEYKEKGNRYYHRFTEYCLKAGGVYELTQKKFDDFVEWANDESNKDKPFVALYVCAGAKLIVKDTYQENVKKNTSQDKRNHNRALVQQGGIVIFKGTIKVSCPSNSWTSKAGSENLDEMNCNLIQWEVFCAEYLDNVNTQNPPPNPAAFTRPVIFLGAVNSKFNSIAWTAGIEAQKSSQLLTPENRQIVLNAPRGGRIIAIVNGEEGISEIAARIPYEILHDSVLTEHDTKFASLKNDILMATKIMNVNDNRSFKVNFGSFYFDSPKIAQREVTMVNFLTNSRQTPKEFNLSTVLEDNFDDWFNSFLQSQNSRLPVPAMYPPACIPDPDKSDEIQKMYYWPSKEIPINEIDYECYGWKDDKLIVELRNPNSPPNSSPTYSWYDPDFAPKIKAYHYERIHADPTPTLFAAYTGKFHVSKEYYRMGVDGWMWKKVSKDPIYHTKERIFRQNIAEESSTNSQIIQYRPKELDQVKEVTTFSEGTKETNRGSSE